MRCPDCQTLNADRYKFCTVCGRPLVPLCPRCHAAVQATHQFCGECGLQLKGDEAAKPPMPVEPEGERKHVTVLFADLSGYTRLADDHDPEDVRDISRRIFSEIAAIVAEYNGFIEKFVGDGVLAIFGLPSVHEDDPVLAVKAALKLHRYVQATHPRAGPGSGPSLRMHSGIHTGLVVTGEMIVEKGVHGIVGGTLNLASRLADMAQPGEILVSPQTHRLIASYFETHPLPSVRLRGIARRLTPFRIVGELGVDTRFEAAKREGFSAFTGRDGELRKLHRSMDKTLSGKGQIVTITGEPGMGKSRLAYEFCHGMKRSEVTILQGRCQIYGGNTPYLPILNALRRYLGPKEESGHEQQANRVAESVLAIDPALEQYLSLYLHLLSIPSRSYPMPGHLTGQKLKNSINQALAAMLLLNSLHKPTMLVLEDWHWADEASDSSLIYLAGLMENYPLMLLIIYRPERAAGWPDWHFRTSIDLKALDSRHTARIIRSNWKVDALPDGFADFIHEHTGGNPLFIEEVCRTLTEDGSVRVDGQEAVLLNPAHQLKLPATVQAVIRARLDRLDRHVKNTLQLAAVIGRKFSLRILDHLSGVRQALPEALAVLKSQGLIQPTGPIPETEFKFKHALTQLTVYESLLMKKRKEIHADIGRVLEQIYAGRLDKQCENLAYHYSHSTDTTKALMYLEMAGGKAARVHSLAEARRYFETALTMLGGQPVDQLDRHRYIDLALNWAEVSQYAPSNQIRNALIQSLEYAQAAETRHRIAEVAYWIGKFGYMQGDFVDAIPRIEDSLRLAETLADRRLLALSTTLYGRSCLYTGEFSKGIRYLNDGLALMASFDAWDDTVYSTAILGMMQGLTGDYKRSLKTIARAVKTARRHEIPTFEAMAFGYLGAVQYWYGNWRAAINNCIKCIGVSKRLGNSLPIIWSTLFRGAALFNSGAQENGLDIMGRSIAMMAGLDSVLALRFFYSLYAEKLALCGKIRDAQSALKKATALGQSGQTWGEIAGHRTLAILSAMQRIPDWRRVEAAMQASITAATRTGATTELMQSLQCYANLMQRKGDEAQARDYHRQAGELAARIGAKGFSHDRSAASPYPERSLAVG